MAITHSFVDYYVISEGMYSFTGLAKNLDFHYHLFPDYANKILYFPIRNLNNLEGGK